MSEPNLPDDDELVSAAFDDLRSEFDAPVELPERFGEPARRTGSRTWIAAAAALVLVAGVGVWWSAADESDDVVAGPTSGPTTSAPTGSECVSVTVYLDPDATLAERRALRDETARASSDAPPVLVDSPDGGATGLPDRVDDALEPNRNPVVLRYQLDDTGELERAEALDGVLAVEGPAAVRCRAETDPTLPDRSAPVESSIPFEVLSRGNGSDDADLLRVATTQGELNDLWTASQASGRVPAIDFSEQFVVAATVPNIRCSTELSDVARTGEGVEIVFAEPSGCDARFPVTTHFVAFDWSGTGELFRLTLPHVADPEFLASEWVGRATDTVATTNEAEDAVIGVLNRLGLQQCCGEPSHGGTGAVTGATWDGSDIPILVAPLEANTFDVDGDARVVVPFNDLVLSARPDTIAGAEVLAGEADSGAFVSFTCGSFLWTLGGVGAFERVETADVGALADSVITELDCTTGPRPSAPGHGNPTGG